MSNAVNPTGSGQFILRDLVGTTTGYLLLIFMAVSLGLLIGVGGLLIGALALGAVIALPMFLLFVMNLKIGSVAMFLIAFTALGLKRFVPEIPVGILIDATSASLILGLIIRLAQDRRYDVIFNAVGIMLLVWIAYNFLQLFNPNAASRMAWLYTVRSFALITLFYYVLSYTMNDVRFVYAMLATWIIIAFGGSLYSYIQEYVGLRGFEWEWLTSDLEQFERMVQWGQIRKWSFFSDPMVFGFVMSYTGVACAALAMGPWPAWVRISLILMTIPFFHSMLFSGTRAAYVLPPVAVAFYVLTRLNLRTVIAAAILGAGLLFLINVPTENQSLVRFQSAFEPEDDASYQVRMENLAFIKPYIQSNPFGGGLGSTGVWGARFSPESPLAQFPPDSGFVRIGVEMGWVGLFLFSLLLIIVLHVGIRNYFLMQDPRLKNIQLTMLLIIVCLIFANFPQEAITSPPNNVVFFFAMAVVTNLIRLDKLGIAALHGTPPEDVDGPIPESSDEPDPAERVGSIPGKEAEVPSDIPEGIAPADQPDPEKIKEVFESDDPEKPLGEVRLG